jgi:hypothetical protein
MAVEDLSNLAGPTGEALTGNASMHGGNTVSVQPNGSAPGSTSEGSGNVPVGNPALDVPDVQDYSNFERGN